MGDKITSLIEEYARRKEKMQHDEKKGKKSIVNRRNHK